MTSADHLQSHSGHQCLTTRSDNEDIVMIRPFPSLYSLYYFTILADFPIALAPFLSVLPLLAIVPAF